MSRDYSKILPTVPSELSIEYSMQKCSPSSLPIVLVTYHIHGESWMTKLLLNHFTPMVMAISKKQNNKVTSVGQEVEKLEPWCIADGNVK